MVIKLFLMSSEYSNVRMHYFNPNKDDAIIGKIELEEKSIKHISEDNIEEIMLEDLRSQRTVEYTKDVSDDSDTEDLESGEGIVIETIGDADDYIFTSEESDMIELKNNISNNHDLVSGEN